MQSGPPAEQQPPLPGTPTTSKAGWQHQAQGPVFRRGVICARRRRLLPDPSQAEMGSDQYAVTVVDIPNLLQGRYHILQGIRKNRTYYQHRSYDNCRGTRPTYGEVSGIFSCRNCPCKCKISNRLIPPPASCCQMKE